MNAIQIYALCFGLFQTAVFFFEVGSRKYQEACNTAIAMAVLTPITGRVMGWW